MTLDELANPGTLDCERHGRVPFQQTIQDPWPRCVLCPADDPDGLVQFCTVHGCCSGTRVGDESRCYRCFPAPATIGHRLSTAINRPWLAGLQLAIWYLGIVPAWGYGSFLIWTRPGCPPILAWLSGSIAFPVWLSLAQGVKALVTWSRRR